MLKNRLNSDTTRLKLYKLKILVSATDEISIQISNYIKLHFHPNILTADISSGKYYKY